MSSDIRSKQFRDEGSAFYRSSKFYEALISYNKSLCIAESSDVKALAFANRSAVYFETKKYQLCLDNIKIARSHGYPAEKVSTLDIREEKCQTLMKQHRPDPREDPWNFFKLSYPANKKIPFIVDCLKLKKDTKYGRHIVTSRDLKPGDIVAIEEPYDIYVESKLNYQRCHKCCKSNMLSLIPCSGKCTNTMFCSTECLNSAKKSHSLFECEKPQRSYDFFLQRIFNDALTKAGSVEELQRCLESSDSTTVFDIDMTNPDDPQVQKNQLRAFLSLATTVSAYGNEDVNDPAVKRLLLNDLKELWKTPEEFQRLHATIQKLFKVRSRVNCNNAVGMSSLLFKEDLKNRPESDMTTVSLFGSLINNSCDPNIIMMPVDNKVAIVVLTPIKANDQLCIAYNYAFYLHPSRTVRRDELFQIYQFECDCIACSNNWTIPMAVEEKVSRYVVNLQANLGETCKNPIKDFKKNCSNIEENFKNHPCVKNFHYCMLSIYLLKLLSCFGSLKPQA